MAAFSWEKQLQLGAGFSREKQSGGWDWVGMCLTHPTPPQCVGDRHLWNKVLEIELPCSEVVYQVLGGKQC